MVASIAVINKSSVAPAEVMAFTRAVNKQILYDVAPRWFRYANVWYAGPQLSSDSLAWKLILMDEPPTKMAGTLGYHEVIGKDIIPVGYVFLEYAKRDGVAWTAIASHEILEMLGNTWISDSTVRHIQDGLIEIWPRELSDAVQNSLYWVDGVSLSNFVLPEYFHETTDGPYDFLKILKAPFSIAPSGYSSILRINTLDRHSSSSVSVTEKIIYGATHPAWRKEKMHFTRRSQFAWGGAFSGYTMAHNEETLPHAMPTTNA